MHISMSCKKMMQIKSLINSNIFNFKSFKKTNNNFDREFFLFLVKTFIIIIIINL